MDKAIKQIVRDYEGRLAALGIRVKESLVFGSHRRGRAERDSDIDLVVISDDLEGMDLWE